jgi:hypothetical protein
MIQEKVERTITEKTRAVQVLIKICLFQGLGTSTTQEVQEYFEVIAKTKNDFVWADDQDDTAIELAFSKKKIVKGRPGWATFRLKIASFLSLTWFSWYSVSKLTRMPNSSLELAFTNVRNASSTAIPIHRRRSVPFPKRFLPIHRQGSPAAGRDGAPVPLLCIPSFSR